MKTVLGEDIKKIDEYAEKTLSTDTYTLMGRAGEAVANTVKNAIRDSGNVLFLAGAGNNGGDAYAAAVSLIKSGFSALVFDVTGNGQKSDAGKRYRAEYEALSGEKTKNGKEFFKFLPTASAVVDGVFGAGFHGNLPETVKEILTSASRVQKPRIAIDVPSGVDASTGEVADGAFTADTTVSLSFRKRGCFISPARLFCGKIVFSDIGLDTEQLAAHFGYRDNVVDEAFARSLLPERKQNTSKGDFGRAVIFAGSARYRGAALLAAEAASRSGCGYTVLYSQKAVNDAAVIRQPSLIVRETDGLPRPSVLREIEKTRPSALLIGCGSGVSEGLYEDICRLLEKAGCPLILDADALGSLALFPEEATERLREAKREVLLTPHPLEFSRLSGIPVGEVQSRRYQSLIEYQKKCKVNITLKGFCTMTATEDGDVFINTSGGSSLAKAGTGDVLAGVITGLVASGMTLKKAAILATYLHGKAGDRCQREYSDYGVIAEDLPSAVAREIAALQKRGE